MEASFLSLGMSGVVLKWPLENRETPHKCVFESGLVGVADWVWRLRTCVLRCRVCQLYHVISAQSGCACKASHDTDEDCKYACFMILALLT